MELAIVFVGAGIGGMLRYAVGIVALRWLGSGFPYGTMAINILGSALMGLVIGVLAARNMPGPLLRVFLTTGVLGGFTTFSTFSLDGVTLWERGEALTALTYVAVSVIVSLAALWAVLMAARHWIS